MPKVTQATILKIRKDISEAKTELTAVREQIAESNIELEAAQAALKNAQVLTDAERSKVSMIWEGVASKLQMSKSVNDSIVKESAVVNDNLAFSKAQLSLMQMLLHDTIKRITDAAKQQPKGLVADLISAMKSNLDRLVRQRNLEAETLELLKQERAGLETSVASLEAQAAGFAGKVAEKAALERQMEEIQRQMGDVSLKIKDIEMRDHDSQVMAFRMTKEYQDIYFKNNPQT